MSANGRTNQLDDEHNTPPAERLVDRLVQVARRAIRAIAAGAFIVFAFSSTSLGLYWWYGGAPTFLPLTAAVVGLPVLPAGVAVWRRSYSDDPAFEMVIVALVAVWVLAWTFALTILHSQTPLLGVID